MKSKPLEKDLEQRCRDLAIRHDGDLLTFRTKAKGWHDRLLLLPDFIALIEFKRGARSPLQPLQNVRHNWCVERRIPAYRVWSFDQFAKIVREHVK